MIQLLQAPSRSFSFKRRSSSNENNDNKSKHKNSTKCLQQALLIGTPHSGKATILNRIDSLNVPLDIIALSNSTPRSTYHNFLFDTNVIIFIMDSTKLIQLKYLTQCSEILTNLITKFDEFNNNTAANHLKLLILVNKCDIASIQGISRLLEKRLKLPLYQDKHKGIKLDYLVIPTCATQGTYGISEGMNWLLM